MTQPHYPTENKMAGKDPLENISPLTPEEEADLKQAVNLLENPGVIVRLAGSIGTPIEWTFKKLPEKWSEKIAEVTEKSIKWALNSAVASLDVDHKGTPSNILHKSSTIFIGAVGGFFGLPALILELPATTLLMLRSIADIARSEGEDIISVESKLACVEVFALGGRTDVDDSVESGYYAARAVLAKTISEATEYIIEKGIADESAPIIIRFVTNIATRFGIPVTEKALAQAVPVIGALGGASLNYIFTDHFQKMARGHFTVRRLERAYGPEMIESKYKQIKNELGIELNSR